MGIDTMNAVTGVGKALLGLGAVCAFLALAEALLRSLVYGDGAEAPTGANFLRRLWHVGGALLAMVFVFGGMVLVVPELEENVGYRQIEGVADVARGGSAEAFVPTNLDLPGAVQLDSDPQKYASIRANQAVGEHMEEVIASGDQMRDDLADGDVAGAAENLGDSLLHAGEAASDALGEVHGGSTFGDQALQEVMKENAEGYRPNAG